MEGKLVYFSCCPHCISEVRLGKSLVITRTTADFDFCEVCGHFTETDYLFLAILVEDGEWQGGSDSDGGDYGYKEIVVIPVCEIEEDEDLYEKKINYIKKIRRRLEDFLRKTNVETIIKLADQLQIKLTL